MKILEEILTDINDLVDRYHTLKLNQVADQSEILRGLSSNLFFLEDHRVEAHEKWLDVYNNHQGTTQIPL